MAVASGWMSGVRIAQGRKGFYRPRLHAGEVHGAVPRLGPLEALAK